MARFSRRTFVMRGGAAAGALGASSVVGSGAIESALAAASGGLSPRRRATYSALVEAVAVAGPANVTATNLGATTDHFDDLYRGAHRSFRIGVDTVLDLLESGAGGGFSSASRSARLQLLRGWAHGPADARHASKPCRELAPVAVTYAALPFNPDASDDPHFAATI
jgi:hypothetical protein